MSLRVCQVVASINELTGGPAWSVAGLSEALVRQGVKTHLLTLDYQNLGPQIRTRGINLHSYTASCLTKYFRGFQTTAKRGLDDLASDSLDIIHNHGLWMRPNAYARLSARRYRLPLVTSPRGMLEPWSLRYSQFKKAIAWHLSEWRNLKQVNVCHATSTKEAESIRQLGFSQPVAVIPNGVDLPSLEDEIPTEQLLTEKFPSLLGKKWLLSMSRIHPKKGFDNLLHIWQELVSRFPDWHLIISGSDLIGYQGELERLVSDRRLHEHVTFTGPLSGRIKQEALRNAALFVLPSHSENFALVIAEALAYGVPVVTTRATPWEDLITHDCGWWVEDDRVTLRNALIEAMKLPAQSRAYMGANGRALVETKYSWNQAAQQMVEVYKWTLGGGPRPDCIRQ